MVLSARNVHAFHVDELRYWSRGIICGEEDMYYLLRTVCMVYMDVDVDVDVGVCRCQHDLGPVVGC